VNIAELHQHYAEVRRRISGAAKRPVCPPRTVPKLDLEAGLSEREIRVVRSLATGLPPASDDLKASIIHMMRAYGVPWMALTGASRVRRVVNCRRAIIWILHLRGWSTTKIANFFGFDHSSIVHALDKINPRREKIDPYLKTSTRNKARRSFL